MKTIKFSERLPILIIESKWKPYSYNWYIIPTLIFKINIASKQVGVLKKLFPESSITLKLKFLKYELSIVCMKQIFPRKI